VKKEADFERGRFTNLLVVSCQQAALNQHALPSSLCGVMYVEVSYCYGRLDGLCPFPRLLDDL
jgi:hypothetical protein